MELRDPVTFGQVYDEHSAGVYGAAMRVLGNPAQAQDVAHDVFLRLWRNPDKFDADRGEVGSYLRLMARSRALDLWRTSQASSRATDRLKITVGREDVASDGHPAPVVEREERRRAVRDALGVLPLAQREALVFAYWGGLTADEIARRAGVPLGTAKSRIRLGLARLRAELETTVGEPLAEAV